MSLIEHALGKAKLQPGKAAHGLAISSIGIKLAPPQPRKAGIPQAFFTPEVRTRLGLVAPPDQEHQRSSEYRQIKRGVVSQIRNDKADNRIVLITSALSGEGKSFTSANLARSLALEPDFTVLLVDADIIKPHLTRSMGLQDKPGLMNALVDTSLDVESLVLPTDIEGLSVLPAGTANEYATEYFASDQMRVVLATLISVPNRIVVIDSLPLLLTTESRAIAPLAGQVLLVVRAESTTQSAVKQSLELVGESANVKFVLNALVRTKLTRYFGYGYGYEYEYGEKARNKKELA